MEIGGIFMKKLLCLLMMFGLCLTGCSSTSGSQYENIIKDAKNEKEEYFKLVDNINQNVKFLQSSLVTTLDGKELYHTQVSTWMTDGMCESFSKNISDEYYNESLVLKDKTYFLNGANGMDAEFIEIEDKLTRNSFFPKEDSYKDLKVTKEAKDNTVIYKLDSTAVGEDNETFSFCFEVSVDNEGHFVKAKQYRLDNQQNLDNTYEVYEYTYEYPKKMETNKDKLIESIKSKENKPINELIKE